ncbi:hypothetical protein CGRA01v4_00581 [Colletotrichum graminicola]|nr:hypothetical protein CGRA01v4_00581 [Colletotrichum graminicola]
MPAWPPPELLLCQKLRLAKTSCQKGLGLLGISCPFSSFLSIGRPPLMSIPPTDIILASLIGCTRRSWPPPELDPFLSSVGPRRSAVGRGSVFLVLSLPFHATAAMVPASDTHRERQAYGQRDRVGAVPYRLRCIISCRLTCRLVST